MAARFFAPTISAIHRALLMDAADPFYSDGEFRKEILLRHFARQSVIKEDLKKLAELKMADGKRDKVTRRRGFQKFFHFIFGSLIVGIFFSLEVIEINRGDIISEAIKLPGDFGYVYMIDRIFVTPDEIMNIVSKHPSPNPFGFMGDGPK